MPHYYHIGILYSTIIKKNRDYPLCLWTKTRSVTVLAILSGVDTVEKVNHYLQP